MPAEFIQTVTIKLEDGREGQFTGPVLLGLNEQATVIGVIFGNPRPVPPGCKVVPPTTVATTGPAPER